MKKLMLLLLLLPLIVYAIPKTLDQQGILRNASDGSLISGNLAFNVSIFNATDDKQIYSEVKTITITDGVWNYVIGKNITIEPLIFRSELYTRTKINNDLLPPINFSRVPYAFYADITNNSVYLRGIIGESYTLDTELASTGNFTAARTNIAFRNESNTFIENQQFNNNITLEDSLRINGFILTHQLSNSDVADNFSVIKFDRNNDPMSIVGFQGGGPGQASWIGGSLMLVNRNGTILNSVNASSCQIQADKEGIELQIDCNSSDINNPLGTGPDLLNFGDYQGAGEMWLRDTGKEWHFVSRTLDVLDELFDDTLFNEVNATLNDRNYTIVSTEGANLIVNLDHNETRFTRNIDSVLITSGTNSSPIMNYIYYGNPSNPTLTVSSTEPESVSGLEHADSGRILLGANSTYGFIGGSAQSEEFITGIYHWLYDRGALYKSGFTTSASTTNLNITTGLVGILLGEIKTITNLTVQDDGFFWVKNDGTFDQSTTLDIFTEYSDGTSITNNKWYNVVFGIVPTSGNTVRIMALVQDYPPVDAEYDSKDEAQRDIESVTRIFPSNAFLKKIFIPIARTVFQKGTAELQILDSGNYFFDMRGQSGISGSSPPSPGITSHTGLTDLDFASAGHTGFQGSVGAYSLTNFTVDHTKTSHYAIGILTDTNASFIQSAVNQSGLYYDITASDLLCTNCLTGTEIAELTDADISNTLTCSDLVTGSSVVADAEVDDDITISTTSNFDVNDKFNVTAADGNFESGNATIAGLRIAKINSTHHKIWIQ